MYHLLYYRSHSGFCICVGVSVLVCSCFQLMDNIRYFASISSWLCIFINGGLLMYLYFSVNKRSLWWTDLSRFLSLVLWGRVAESCWPKTARLPFRITVPSTLFLRNHGDAISSCLCQHWHHTTLLMFYMLMVVNCYFDLLYISSNTNGI